MARRMDDFYCAASQLENRSAFHRDAPHRPVFLHQRQKFFLRRLRVAHRAAAFGIPGARFFTAGIALLRQLDIHRMQVNFRKQCGCAVMVKMAVCDGNRERLIGKFPNRLGRISDAGTAVDEQRSFIALQQIHIHQFIFTDEPGARCDFDNRFCKHMFSSFYQPDSRSFESGAGVDPCAYLIQGPVSREK